MYGKKEVFPFEMWRDVEKVDFLNFRFGKLKTMMII